MHHELVWFEIDVDGGEERTFAKGMMDRKETDYLLSGAQYSDSEDRTYRRRSLYLVYSWCLFAIRNATPTATSWHKAQAGSHEL